MRYFRTAVLCLAVLFAACHKNKRKANPDPGPQDTELAKGLPENPRAIHGYFFAGISNYNYDLTNYKVTLYAAFHDPAASLTKTYDHVNNNLSFSELFGNVAVGSVQFSNAMNLSVNGFGGSQVSYLYNTPFQQDVSNIVPAWLTAGNGSFKPLNISLTRGFPVITPTIVPSTASYSVSLVNDFVVTADNFISNYDSLIVTIIPTSSSNQTIKKKVSAPGTSVTFTKNELAGLPSGSWSTNIIYFQACNYSHITINGKLYLFELSNKYQNYVYVNP